MKGPKCSTGQADAAQCASCGVYVEKYQAYLAQKTIGRPMRAHESERKSPCPLGIVI